MDFSTDSKYIQVATENYEKKIFIIQNGEPLKDKTVAGHITWQTWTGYIYLLSILKLGTVINFILITSFSFLGPEVAGIWPSDANPADINCAHVSNSGNSLVTGDDSGFVKLFRFPCSDKHVRIH